MLALARPSVNEVWPLAANQNHRFNRPANDNNITSGLCTRTKYTYDAADRLKTVTQGATTVTFGYDGLGRRLKQTVSATETRYLWCGATICQQRNGSDTAEKRFYGEGEYVHTGTKKYLTLRDHLGSVRDVIDITGTATLVGSFDYRPYGEVARSWGTITPGYTYAGLFAQTNTGLLLSATRAHDPSNGRWLNRDPIREVAGPNGYTYVNAMPVVETDILGLYVLFVGSPGIVERLKEMYGQIRGTVRGRYLLGILERSPDLFVFGYYPGKDGDILFNKTFEGEPATIISVNPDHFPVLPIKTDGSSMMCEAMPTPPVITMAHEIGHAAEGNPFGSSNPEPGVRIEYEIGNIERNENPIRRELGFPERLPVY